MIRQSWTHLWVSRDVAAVANAWGIFARNHMQEEHPLLGCGEGCNILLKKMLGNDGLCVNL